MKYISKEERPWGRFYILNESKKFKIKKIEVDPNQRLSYQFHKKRSEVWVIVEGTAHITLDGKTLLKKRKISLKYPKI